MEISVHSLLFRFHSTVVLVDCWKNSYRRGAMESLISNMKNILIDTQNIT